MANKFFVSPSPHIHGEQTTQKIMADVIIALLPALCVSTVVYGWGVLLLTAIAVASCVLFEFLIQKFVIKGPLTICNLSAALTGLLLAFNLPLGLPWWIVVIGAFVAIAFFSESNKLCTPSFALSTPMRKSFQRPARPVMLAISISLVSFPISFPIFSQLLFFLLLQYVVIDFVFVFDFIHFLFIV